MTWPTTARLSPAWLLPLRQKTESAAEDRMERKRRINRESKRLARAGLPRMSRTEALELGRRLRLLRRPYFSNNPGGRPNSLRSPDGRFRSGADTGTGQRTAGRST